MSADILLATTGRLAAATRSLTTQPGGTAVDAAGKSHAVQRFGALLEKPQGKASAKGEEAEGTGPDGKDEPDAEAAPQAMAFAVPQNILNLAIISPNQKAESHNFATQNDAKPAIDPGANRHENGAALAEAMPGVSPEVKKKNDTARPQPETPAQADGKPASKPGQSLTQAAADVPQGASAEPAAGDLADFLKNGQPVGEKPANDIAVDRPVPQPPEVAAKASGPVEIRAADAPRQAVRVADVQVVSERSSGMVKTLQIRLDPAELGQVTARIRVTQDGVEVHLVAEKAQAAEALAADRSGIEKALKTTGIGEDARISVTVADRNPVQHSAAGQQAGQQQQAFNMQGGFDGRNGAQSQSQSQAQSASGEGRQNGDSGHRGEDRSGPQNASGQAARETLSGSSGRNRGLVV